MKARTTPCPARDEFEKFFLNSAGIRSRERLLDHARSCASCRARFDVLLETGREIRAREGEFGALARASLAEWAAPAPIRRPAVARWAAAAAAVLIAGAAVLFFLLRGPLGQASLRGSTGQLIHALSPQGTVSAPPQSLRWKAVEGAVSYQIEVIDDRLNPVLARTEVRTNVFALPSDAFDRLRPGRTYVWSVEARDDQALTIGAAQAFFEIRAAD